MAAVSVTLGAQEVHAPTRRAPFRSNVRPVRLAAPAAPAAPARFGLDVRAPRFGAEGDGLTDDTAAIQAAIDEAIAQGGDVVVLPRGTYNVTSSLVIAGIHGFCMRGAGAGATTLFWRGDAGRPLLRVVDAYSSVIEDLALRSTADAPLSTGIHLENGPEADVPPSRTTLRNIVIDGTHAGGLSYGVRFALGAGGDNNNDFHLIQKVSVNNYAVAGFSLEGAQAKALLFQNCVVSGNGIGENGVSTWRGPGARGGSFTWIGGGGGGNTLADFHLGTPNAPVSIQGASFENSPMLLDTEGPSGGMWPVTIRDTRWSVQTAMTPLRGHGYVIRFRNAGPLTIEGCTLDVFSAGDVDGVGEAQIRIETLAEAQAMRFQGNALTIDTTDLFDGLEPTTHGANLIQRGLDESPVLLRPQGF